MLSSGHRFLIGILALGLATGLALRAREPVAGAEQTEPRSFDADAVKAAFLVNFVRFVTWPNEAQETRPFVIVVAGNRPLEDALLRIADRQRVRDRALRIVRFRSPLDLDEAHLVFIEPPETRTSEQTLPEEAILASLQGKPVLTVGMKDNFLARGGLVRLYLSGDNLRFTIDAERTAASGLIASSRLLALGRERGEPASRTEP